MLAMNSRSFLIARRLLLRLSLAAGLACLAAGPPCQAGQVDLTTAHLSDLLIPGNYAIVNNERFDTFGWSVTTSGGAMSPDPANIKVSAIMSGGDTGLFFQGGPFLTIGNQTVDAHLTFDVTSLDPADGIDTAKLDFTAATAGGGSASISEVVRGAANNQLGQQLVIEQQNLPNGGQSFAEMTFPPQTTVQVSKDILLVGNAFAGTGNINVAQMSDFSQIFNPVVPEPGGLVLAMFGSGGVGWFGWRQGQLRKLKLRKDWYERAHPLAA